MSSEEVYICGFCHGEIYEGDDYYEFDGKHYHDECFSDNAVDLLVDVCGAVRGVAEKFVPDLYESGDFCD